MAKIIKGYKQGRGVAFYDIEDKPHGQVMIMVTKEETVKLIGDGKITNAKIQWWEGKPIVRVQDKIELVKLNGAEEQKIEKRTVHKRESADTVSPAIKAQIVGKISKKSKNETVYEAIIKREVAEHQKLKSSVNYKGMTTLEDLLNSMLNDFRLKNVEQYKLMISKKVKLSTKISSLAQDNLINIQQNMAAYLMNMCYVEIRDTYTKYI